MRDIVEQLSQKAKDQIIYMLDLTSAAQNYQVRLYAPYYRGFTGGDIWAQAIDDIIEDEIDWETLKSHLNLLNTISLSSWEVKVQLRNFALQNLVIKWQYI